MSHGSSTSLCSSMRQQSLPVHPEDKENIAVSANHAAEKSQLPAFAFKHAPVNVSLSSTASSELSVPAEESTPLAATSNGLQPELHIPEQAINPASQGTAAGLSQPDPPTVLQLLSQLDSIKWENVANWASQDSAEAAALCNKLVPLMAESVIEQDQVGDDSISRLELQVARKKLVSSRVSRTCILQSSSIYDEWCYCLGALLPDHHSVEQIEHHNSVAVQAVLQQATPMAAIEPALWPAGAEQPAAAKCLAAGGSSAVSSG